MSNEPWRLVADVGGTNVRLGRVNRRSMLSDLITYHTEDFQSLECVLSQYLSASGGLPGCEMFAIGAAGPVDGAQVRLTNRDWVISSNDLSVLLSVPVILMNDVEAAAMALPGLDMKEFHGMGGPSLIEPNDKRMLLVNVGTGFGASLVVGRSGNWWTLSGEPGHMLLESSAAYDLEVGKGCTVEDLLSGRGIERLYERLTGTKSPAAAILASPKPDCYAAQIVDIVTDRLGQVCGNLVLAMGAWGGLFLCGSIAVAWSAVADTGRFRAAFEGTGAMCQRMRQVPTAVIPRQDIALLGLVAAFKNGSIT